MISSGSTSTHVAWNVYDGRAIRNRLTDREFEIMAMRCVGGLSNREIGERIGLQEQSVKNLISGILRKLPEYRRVEQICMRIGQESS